MNQDETRFKFGENWANFLKVLSDQRITEAENSLKSMLEVDSLHGQTFLDVGSGSGLFSLCARRLGATVFSFDYDQHSVNCTKELKHRYFPNDPNWEITQGSVLDKGFLSGLGTFDIVYAWGVLHHTGDMWAALENVAPLVNEKGGLFLAIYNDQGRASVRWKMIKKLYNQLPTWIRPLYVFLIMAPGEIWAILNIGSVLRLNFMRKLKTRITAWREYKKSRGMSYWYDWVDWVGGFPFEVAKPNEIFLFYRDRGFLLENMLIDNQWGNNQFVFRKPHGVGLPDNSVQLKA